MPVPSSVKTNGRGIAVVDSVDDAAAILDWKGEPMTINPGDVIPRTVPRTEKGFKFQ